MNLRKDHKWILRKLTRNWKRGIHEFAQVPGDTWNWKAQIAPMRARGSCRVCFVLGNSGHVVLTIKGKLKGLARGPSRAEFASSWETLGT